MPGLVESWFGESFQQLDPLIQRLHRSDHTLEGFVKIEYSKGLAGKVGRSIGQKLGLPASSGNTLLVVSISHTKDYLIWSRQFGEAGGQMVSKFYPLGAYPNGGWRESTEGLDVTLGVEIRNGAWYWTQKSVSIYGVPAPAFTSPKVVAYKEVIQGKYKFYVEFSLPGLGRLFTYRGLLEAKES